MVSVVALMLAPAAGSMVAPVCAAASRSSSATATRSSSASATARLLWQRQVRPRSVGGQDRHAVGVGPEARAGLGHVVRDEQVDALAPELVGGPLERARLGGEPDQDRDRLAAARAWRRRRCRGRGRSGRPRRAGPGWTPARGSGRRVARELGLGRGDRPEVGHGRGHDQRVEAGGRPAGPWVRRRSAARRSAVELDPDDRRPPAAASTSTLAATTVTRAPRSSAASAMAAPIRPVERLPMKRTGSIASRVPPAVTTTWRPARSASRAGPTRGGRAAGSGARTGRSATAATTASTIAPSSASRPTPSWPDASGPDAGLDDRVAERPQPRDVGDGGRMAPHVAVHGRCDHDRRRRRQARRGHDVAGQAARHRPEPVRGGRRDDDHVRRVGDDDVADPAVGQQVEHVGLDRVARQGGERQRRRRTAPRTGSA